MEMPEIKKAMPVGYDLAEQLAIWLEENDWSGHSVSVSLTPDSDVATVDLDFTQFDGLSYNDLTTHKHLVYALWGGLSEDFELVSVRSLSWIAGRPNRIVFTVKKAN